MSDSRRKKVDQIKRDLAGLDLADYHEILEAVMAMMKSGDEKVEAPGSLLELKGLGKELWESVDVAAYINQERDTW